MDPNINSQGEPGHKSKGTDMRKWGGISISLFVIVTLIITGFFTLSSLTTHSAKASDSSQLPPTDQRVLQSMGQAARQSLKLVKAPKASTSLTSNATAAVLPAYNNAGTSDDSNTRAANFDGGGYSYSAQALSGSHLAPGKPFTYDGVTFTWPNVGSGSNNNYIASGQVLPVSPVSNATNLSFLGAANNGPTTGQVKVSYNDGTYQLVSLGMSDWTLSANTVRPSYGNQTVASMAYRNGPSGRQSVKVFIFYATIPLTAGKTVTSVTLPTSVNQGRLHVFAVGTRSYYNNIGISNDNNPGAGNFDGGGASFSAQQVDMVPGATYTFRQLQFVWPGIPFTGDPSTYDGSTYVASPDNYIASGQTIPVTEVSGANTIGFIGSATNGPSIGAATINYSDGSTQAFKLGMTDWTLNGMSKPASYSDQLANFSYYRNTASGKQNIDAFMYYQGVPLLTGKTVTSVTLPSSMNQGQIHIFSIGTGYQNTYNNVGTSNDYGSQTGDPRFSDFDGSGYSYSVQAMAQVGLKSTNSTLQFNGMNFPWYPENSDMPDNFVAVGQTIPVTPVANATVLAFIGSAAGGAASGNVAVNYTDGTYDTFRVGITDWCATQTSFGNLVVASMSYRNNAVWNSTTNGKQTIKNSLYYAEVGLTAGKTVQSVTLPASTSGGTMHVFSIGTRAGNFNNIGIGYDGTANGANFDGSGYSYSNNGLNAAGFQAGVAFTPKGLTNISFTRATTSSGNPDNYLANGQTINVPNATANASTLGFLGSSTNGPLTGSITVEFTDNTSQTFSLGFTDWCNGTLSYGNQVAMTMTSRLTSSGASQTINNYIFYAGITMPTGKTVKSVTLPAQASKGALHVFAVATSTN